MDDWKLRKEETPEFYDEEEFEDGLKKEGLSAKVFDNHKFSRLYGREGIFGLRPGNVHGMSRRKWIETMLMIQGQDGIVVPFVLNDSQRRLEAEILRMERAGIPVRLVILKARKQGFSSYIAAFTLWYASTHRQGRAVIIAHRKETGQVIFGALKLMAQTARKPSGIEWRFGFKELGHSKLVWDEPIYSSVMVDTAEAKEPGRGNTAQVLHESENPSWPAADSKIAAVRSVLGTELGTYRFSEATAKGDANQFARSFKEAWRANRPGKPIQFGERAIFFPWFHDQRARYSYIHKRPLPAETALYLERTADEEEKILLQTRYLRKGHGWVNVDLDQIACRRHFLEEKCARDMNKLHEEYPSTPEEAFIASGARFFDGLAIAKLRTAHARDPLWRGELIDPEGDALVMRRLPEMIQTPDGPLEVF